MSGASPVRGAAMRGAGRAIPRPSPVGRALGLGARGETAALWAAAVGVQLLLALVNLRSGTYPIGDVRDVYRGWVLDAAGGSVPGLDGPFVYPILALVPMLLAGLLGDPADPELYARGWFAVAAFAALVGTGFLAHTGRDADERGRRRAAAWFLVLFTALLGPIATGRIDAIVAPLAIPAILALRSRPLLAGAGLAALAWMKIWPAAPFAAGLALLRGRRMPIAAGGAAVTGAVLLAAALAGGWPHVLSFVTEQTGRGLQVESALATPFAWLAAVGDPSYRVYYDLGILTFQVEGPGTSAAAALGTPLLGVGALLVLGLAARALRRGAPGATLLMPTVLGLVLVLILGNKVGSPQFATWVGAAAAAALAADGWRFARPAALALLGAALTQLVYPWCFDAITEMNPLGATLLALRNGAYLALLAWMLRNLWRAGSAGEQPAERLADLVELDEEAVVAEGGFEDEGLVTRDRSRHGAGDAVLGLEREEDIGGDADDERRARDLLER